MTAPLTDLASHLDRADRVPVWNRLVPFLGPALPLPGGRASAAIALADAPPPGLPRFGLSVGDLAVTAAFADFPFDALVGIPLSAADLGDLGAPLRDALTAGMVETVAALLPAPFTEARLAAAGPLPADAEWTLVTIEGASPRPIRFHAAASRSAIAGLFAAMAPDLPPARGLLAATPVRLAATLVRLAVPRGALSTLGRDRIVVLDRDASEKAALRLCERTWSLAADPGGWRVTRIGPPAAVAVDPTRDGGGILTSDPADPSADGGDLLLPVDFDIGSIRVSLADIDAWRVGSVLALDLPALADGLPVAIRIGEAEVGRGDLVRIEDRYAVRITALRPGRT